MSITSAAVAVFVLGIVGALCTEHHDEGTCMLAKSSGRVAHELLQSPDDINDDIDNDDNNLLDDNNNDDLLDQKPGEHLGGFKNIVKSALDESLQPLASQVEGLQKKLNQLENKKLDIAETLQPVKAQLEAQAKQDAESDANLEDKVQAVASRLKDLQGLKAMVGQRASKEQLDTLASNVGDAAGKATSNVNSVKKTTEKNQKYLKRIYKDLHR